MSHKSCKIFSLLVVVLMCFHSESGAQSEMPLPQQSPKALVSQTIGITDVTISYHRPSVNGRTIWGVLVPYNEVWRAGANENTTISFTSPVKIEGKDLPAGTYGLHMIPTENTWTVIFSKNATSWGSFFYKESEDILRITVQPKAAMDQEMLSYEFENVSNTSAVIALRWEKLMVPIKIDIDTKDVVISNARDSYLRGLAGFGWQGFSQAAAYCVRNNLNLDEAMQWIDKSIQINENVTNLFVKADLLEKIGKKSDAELIQKRIVKVAASEADFNLIGYQYLGAGKRKEAIDIFRKNVKSHPDSWNAFDSLGEAYAENGESKLAIENYTRALNMVKDEANRKRISDILQKLGKK